MDQPNKIDPLADQSIKRYFIEVKVKLKSSCSVALIIFYLLFKITIVINPTATINPIATIMLIVSPPLFRRPGGD